MVQPWDVVIVGAGMAGLSTAIWVRRLGLSAVVLEGAPEPGGQLTAIRGPIVDYPGLDGIEGTALRDRVVRQAIDAGAELRLNQPVVAVDSAGLACETAQGRIAGRSLVIATGIRPRRLGVPGEEDLHRLGLVRRPSQDLDWFRGKRVAVIGGGDRAAENGLMLAAVAHRVILLHRGLHLRARPALAEPLLVHGGVEVRLGTQVRRFRLAGQEIAIDLVSDGVSSRLHVDAVCIYIGNQPNSALVQGQVDLDGDGYIVTDRRGQTSSPGVYAAGDVCTPPAFQSLANAAGQAMVVAKQIALSLERQ